MTEQQLRGQLARLKIFGQLDELEYQGYEMALKDKDYTCLVRAIDGLIISRDRRGFPYPSEILAAIKEQYKPVAPTFSTSGDTEVTKAFLSAFFRIFELPDKDMFQKYRAKLLEINNKYGDNSQYRAAAIADFGSLSTEVDKITGERLSQKKIQELPDDYTPDENLPF